MRTPRRAMMRTGAAGAGVLISDSMSSCGRWPRPAAPNQSGSLWRAARYASTPRWTLTFSQDGKRSVTGTTAGSSQPRCPVTRRASSEGPASSVSALAPISTSRRRPRARPRRSSKSGGGGGSGLLTRSTMPRWRLGCQGGFTQREVSFGLRNHNQRLSRFDFTGLAEPAVAASKRGPTAKADPRCWLAYSCVVTALTSV